MNPPDLNNEDETNSTNHNPEERELTDQEEQEEQEEVKGAQEEGQESQEGQEKEEEEEGDFRGESRGGESMVSERSEFLGMWTDDGKYLAEALGDALIKSLSDVNEARPKDPISYLACCLYSYRYNNNIGTRTLPADKNDKNASQDAIKTDTSNSIGSGHSSIAMKTAVESTGGGDTTHSPQKRDRNGQSVLHFAAGRPHGREAFYRLLEEAGCSLADRDHQYQTPRDVAMQAGLMENVAAIDKWVVNLVVTGNVAELRELVLGGYDQMFEVTDSAGRNLMEIAHLYGQERIVHFLTEAINFLDKRDWLHKAIRVGSLPHVEYIADTEDVAIAKDTKGRTSLHLATLCEETEIMQFLASQYPTLLMLGDNLGRTPLHYAMAVEGVDRVAKVLVQAGARRAMRDLREKLPSYYFMNRDEIVAMIKEVTVEDME